MLYGAAVLVVTRIQDEHGFSKQLILLEISLLLVSINGIVESN